MPNKEQHNSVDTALPRICDVVKSGTSECHLTHVRTQWNAILGSVPNVRLVVLCPRCSECCVPDARSAVSPMLVGCQTGSLAALTVSGRLELIPATRVVARATQSSANGGYPSGVDVFLVGSHPPGCASRPGANGRDASGM
jgi:hypothetical protein